MKQTFNFLAVVLVIFTMSIQSVFALTTELRTVSTCNENCCMWVNHLDYQTNNVFQSSSIEIHGDYVDVIPFQKKDAMGNETKFRLHLNGGKFDNIEIVGGTYHGWTNEELSHYKNDILDFINTTYQDTVKTQKENVGEMKTMSFRRICILVLAHLLEKFLLEHLLPK